MQQNNKQKTKKHTLQTQGKTVACKNGKTIPQETFTFSPKNAEKGK